MVRDAMQPRLPRTDELVLDSFMPNSTALVTIIAHDRSSVDAVADEHLDADSPTTH